MSKAAVNPIPEGYHALTPMLVCAGAAAAIEFYKKAFGAVELSRLPGPGGTLLHALVRIGDSNMALTDEVPSMGARAPKALGGSPVTIRANTTGSAPLRRSPVTTTTAHFGPRARSALVPPVRPDPIVRGSVPPAYRATSTPTGIDPAR